MKQLVSVNLTTRTADWTPPVMFFGETLTLGLRFQRTAEGVETETTIDVESFSAMIGDVDRPPRGGKWALKVGNEAASGTNTTPALDAAITAGDLKTKLAAVAAVAAYGAPKVIAADGSWLLMFGNGTEQVPLEVVNNSLWPISYGRVTAWQDPAGKWVHEVRLLQGPVAATNSYDVVLPMAPQVTRLQAGGTDPSGTTFWNEIQELYVPADFRGAFILKRGFAKTTLLSREDDTDAIQDALQALGANAFKVTLPLSQRPAIEFIGDFAGQPQDLLAVEVKQAPPGDLTFSIVLDRAELGAALRVVEEIVLPLEIRVNGSDAAGFSGELVALSLPVVIRRPVTWPVLATRPTIDWLRPFSPKSYVPHGANNYLTGNKFYADEYGNGESVTFVIGHALATEMVFVYGRENVPAGRQLVHGVDFSVTVDGPNQVTVTALGEVPGVNAWILIVIGAQTIAQWATGLTVTVPQVIAGSGYPSLPDFMDDAIARIVVLENLVVPGVPAARPTTPTMGMVTVIPEIAEVLHFRGTAEEMAAVFGKAGVDATRLSSNAPLMLPAVHDAAVTDPLPDPLPSAVSGSVWKAAVPTLIPGGRGIRSRRVAANGFVASDGRLLFPAERSGATNSYYPSACERTLFAMSINDQMLALNKTLEILWGVQAQLVHATCKAQWVLVVELGTFTAETEPATLGLNLENVAWGSPVFAQPIVLSRLAQSHFFGVRILRTASAFKLDQQRYGSWMPNNAAAPASGNFAIRSRLIQFDTENRTDPRGWVAWKLIGSIDISESGDQTTKPAQARIY